MHRWQIVPTPQGPTLHIDGRVVGSPGLPPPPGWLQRAYGITLPIAYDRARMRVLGYASRVSGGTIAGNGYWQEGECRPWERICGIVEMGPHMCCPVDNGALTYYGGMARLAVLAGEIPLPVHGPRGHFWPPKDNPDWGYVDFLDGSSARLPPEPAGIPGEWGNSSLYRGRTDGLLGIVRDPNDPGPGGYGPWLDSVYFQGREEGRAVAEQLPWKALAPCPDTPEGWMVSAEIVEQAERLLDAWAREIEG